MASTSPFFQCDAKRARSYIVRLPLCTRLLGLVTVGFFIASLTLPWFPKWAALIPNEVALTSMHRINTYPFLHLGFIHFFLNILALIPLLERFEAEFGTLITLALFTGPFSTLPGGLYVLIEKFIFHSNIGVQGASIWIFLLMASEAIKTWKANPNFEIGGVKIPTWTYPCAVCLVISALIPASSFTGHVCGLLIGYLWGLGYIKFLVPSERILRWVEGKLNLLGRLPHYVSVDQKTYGRYGVLPSVSGQRNSTLGSGIQMRGMGQRVGP
ncbi:putative rhomboid family protein [Elsinoe ampelina]|uniref:rhomboid protease n=1 Tax=Elsinoe ampelina TaxID=302913 RepID=A0A6A6GFK1_9PEZI|nr:putative rhomboid family protein [Elsinoe ampelina]